MITKKQLSRIEAFSKSAYVGESYDHGISHMKRTMRIAKMLAKKEKAEVNTCVAAAMLHQFHNAKKVRKFLEAINIEKECREKIAECVHHNELHKMKKNAKISKEAKVVFDADKLQVLGPFGFLRELASQISRDRENFADAVKRSKVLQEKIISLLQTKTAKRIAYHQQKPMKHFFDLYSRMEKA